MTDERLDAAQTPVASPAPPVPIWAPNPGVPLIARVLSYAFAVLILLAVVSSTRFQRPPDIPDLPDNWASYMSYKQIGFSYPADWVMRSHPVAQGLSVVMTLTPGSPVRVETLLLKDSGLTSPDAPPLLRRQVENGLRDTYLGYARLPGARPNENWLETGGEFVFQERKANGEPLPMYGIWGVRIIGERGVVLVALTPQGGRSAMTSIFTHMMSSVYVGKDKRSVAAGAP